MNANTGTEQEILDRAIQAVEREAGLFLQVIQREIPADDRCIDAVVQLAPGHQTLMVEIKKWAQHANLGALINQLQQLPEVGLLVADYVNPKMAEKLRRQGVQFIDTFGNAYINQPPVYVYVTANRQSRITATVTKAGSKRAFEPTGLKVIYAFLRDPNLVNAPYRRIAEQADVALGTVGSVINSLKDAGLIADEGENRGRRIVYYRKLLDRWIEAWPETLKPKLLIGEFVADDPYWWKGIEIGDFGGYWGGEVAAAKYTGYLKPKIATVYLPEEKRIQLLREARLRKSTDWTAGGAGTVLLYRMFWSEEVTESHEQEARRLVHPILVYADLIATGDPRNREVARKLYDEYIAGYNGEG